MIQWLRPGLQIKRWLLLLFVGVLLCGLGVALLLVQLYREVDFGEGGAATFVYVVFLEFVQPQWLRGLILIAVSGSLLIGGLVLQAGSMRLDASVRGRLERLRQELASN